MILQFALPKTSLILFSFTLRTVMERMHLLNSQGNKTQKGHGTSKCHTSWTELGRGRSAIVPLGSTGSRL